MTTTPKNCDDYVVHAEEVAQSAGFRLLRDRIVGLRTRNPMRSSWTSVPGRACSPCLWLSAVSGYGQSTSHPR
jgi:hypothetical protein